MAQGEQINSAILVWARETAGLDVRDAAHKLGLPQGDADSQTKLLELERGTRLPSRTLLSKIARTYRRPVLTFYLAAPPKRAERGSDFRTTGADISERDDALLSATLRDIQARQEMLTSALEDEDDLEALPFVGSCSFKDDPESVAERMGVYVLLVGDLGSHHSALSEEVFRGSALADPRVPFIVINDQDAKAARSFTLIHELVHIYLGESGVSGTPEQAQGTNSIARVEQFCNEAASLVLLPQTFESQWPESLRVGEADSALRYIEKTAKTWAVSEPLVAFRLRRLGWITTPMYQQFGNAFARRWQEQKASTKVKNRMNEGGPSYYTVKQYRLGDALVDAVHRTVRENRLTHTKAAKILGMKPASVEPMFRHFERRSYAVGERR